jgi:putative metalloprotease
MAGCNTDGSGSGLSSTLGSLGGSSGSSSSENKVGAVLDVFKAVTVSDDEVKSVSLQMRQTEDKKYAAKASTKYAKRLTRLTRKHVNEDGLTLNFKVYATEDVNANATPDGSIRVYSGLMDLMNDQELLGVIGHEIGHVKLGHSMSSVRTAYLASAGRKAAASSGSVGGALAASELGALTEAVVNSQFSQSQETASDDYGLAFMKKHGYDVKAMESALRKLASLSGKKAGALESMLSTHPDPDKRADRVHEMIGK